MTMTLGPDVRDCDDDLENAHECHAQADARVTSPLLLYSFPGASWPSLGHFLTMPLEAVSRALFQTSWGQLHPAVVVERYYIHSAVTKTASLFEVLHSKIRGGS
jgi:hypothetical protein